MENIDLFMRCGVALGIGFIIGLQREFSQGGADREIVAGERTFALMGLSGCLAAFLSDQFGSALIFIGSMALLAVLTAIAYYVESFQKGQIGLTTEIAILITVLLGALCYWGYIVVAVAAGIATTVLLSLKIETDRLVSALTREDIIAALQLAVISAIILPILPNESLLPPPFDVLNPFKIWLMVVFITGINFLGYILIKVIGTRQGIGITGFLGGLVSSTAVTLSFTERSKRQINFGKPLALAITVAWTVMFIRVLIEVGVLNLQLLRIVWVPIAAGGAVGLLYAIYLYFSQRTTDIEEMNFKNPFDLKSAIQFGVLYAFILLLSRTAMLYLGDTGVYLSSLVSGMADVDAITLSVSELTRSGSLGLEIAARAIVIAVVANTLIKGGIVFVGGSRNLKRAILPGFILMIATVIVVAFLVT